MFLTMLVRNNRIFRRRGKGQRKRRLDNNDRRHGHEGVTVKLHQARQQGIAAMFIPSAQCFLVRLELYAFFHHFPLIRAQKSLSRANSVAIRPGNRFGP
jgi:hypothetical protein